jgi:ABC-2 type transport system permease protein
MLANVFTKTVRDRWKGVTIAAVSLAVMLLFGMAVYRDLDLSVYTDLPEALRALMNVADDANAGSLAYGAIYSSYGALALASLALSMGSASIAGEERDGTIGLLLANPKSRTRVLVSKATSMLVLTGAGALVLWGAGLAIPAVLDVDISEMHVGALVMHMYVISLFFGFLSMAIGGWTGKRGLASGATAGILVLSFFAVGLFPFIEGWENAARVFPWYYYDAGSPVTNGIHWGHLGVLAGGMALLGAIAVVGLNRRDLREQGVAVTLLDRLRRHPRTQKIMERLAGSARVSRISVKTASDHQTLTIVVGYIVLLVGVVMGPFYLSIDETLRDFADQFPEALLAMIGYADLGTAEGWYQTENFSLTIPIALIVVTAVVGSKALAGEEARRTMGLLLANPVSRATVVIEKAFAMIGIATVIGVLTFAGAMIGSMLARFGMSFANVAATSALVTLLSLVFGALALALSAATGRVSVASFGTAGAALAFYIVNAFLPLNESLAGFAKWSPFYYYLSSDPLNNGMPWGHAAVLAGLAAGLIGVSIVSFGRRDLRQTG